MSFLNFQMFKELGIDYNTRTIVAYLISLHDECEKDVRQTKEIYDMREQQILDNFAALKDNDRLTMEVQMEYSRVMEQLLQERVASVEKIEGECKAAEENYLKKTSAAVIEYVSTIMEFQPDKADIAVRDLLAYRQQLKDGLANCIAMYEDTRDGRPVEVYDPEKLCRYQEVVLMLMAYENILVELKISFVEEDKTTESPPTQEPTTQEVSQTTQPHPTQPISTGDTPTFEKPSDVDIMMDKLYKEEVLKDSPKEDEDVTWKVDIEVDWKVDDDDWPFTGDEKPTSDRDEKPTSDRDEKLTSDRDEKPTSDRDEKPTSDRDDTPTSDRDEKPTSDRDDTPTNDRDDMPTSDRDDTPTDVVVHGLVGGHEKKEKEVVEYTDSGKIIHIAVWASLGVVAILLTVVVAVIVVLARKGCSRRYSKEEPLVNQKDQLSSIKKMGYVNPTYHFHERSTQRGFP